MNREEFDITDGKKLLYLVFGASRWEFERIEEGTLEIPAEAESCLERIRSTAYYLLKYWRDIPAEDRAMGEAGITHDLLEVKSRGFSIKGIKSYGVRLDDDADARKYTAYLRILKDE